MTVCLISFASELVKLSEAKDKERQGYGKQMLAAAPFAVTSAAADVPKGWVDSTVEQKLRGSTAPVSNIRKGIARGSGRLGAGLVTSPVFLSGIKDLRSGDPERRKRGYAKIVGSGFVFGASKGAIEATVMSGKGDLKAIARKVGKLGQSRGIVGMGAAALTAGAVAKATKKPKKGEKPKSLWGSYGMPAATGAAIGAGKGAFDEVYDAGRKATLRGVGSAAGGRAAAGALGAAALTGLVKKFTKDKKTKNRPGYRLVPSKRDPSKRRWQKTASEQTQQPQPSMYADVSSWAKNRNTVEVHTLLKDVTAGGLGERSQSRRSAMYALQDDLARKGRPSEGPQGPRVKTLAPSLASKASLVAVALAPEVVMATIMAMPPDTKDLVLADALDRMFIQNKIKRVESATYMAWPQGGPKHGVPEVHLPSRGKALPGVVAHELGHMNPSALRRATIGSDVATRAMRFGAVAAIALPLAAVVSAGDGKYATPEELERKAKFVRTIGTLTAAAQLPGVAEEAVANMHAVRLLRNAGDTGAAARVLRQAGPGFATYLMPLVLPVLAARMLERKARKQ